jgi:oligopeptide transport system ATP-binding protein
MSEAVGPILSVEHLSVVFHTYAGIVHAVRDVSFSLSKGEVMAIVGESGSGKSVTAQAIMGLTPVPPGEIRSGAVTYGGTDLIGATPEDFARIRGDRISMIFQDPMTSLNPSMKIGTQIREVLHQHKATSRAVSRARAIELLRLVGIPEPETRLGQYPHQFSGGIGQRIMIAIAIANNPDILIADEPTTALDVTIQSRSSG